MVATIRAGREVDLEDSGALHRAMMDASVDGFLCMDVRGRILETNAAYARRSGYSREELVGMHATQVAPNADVASVDARVQQVMRAGSISFESVQRARDGELWPAEVTATYSAAGGGRVFSILRDITAKKRTEQLLKARLALSEQAIGRDLDAVIQATLDHAEQLTGSTIGFFHFVGPNQDELLLQTWSTHTLEKMCNAKGKGDHYAISKAGVWVDCFHQRKPVIHNDYASVPNKKGLPAGHAAVTRELLIPILRGDKVWAIMGVGNKPRDYTQEDVDVANALAALAYDLVEAKRTEESLKRSEQRFRSLFDTMAQGVVYQDDQGRITSANPAACQILGLTLEQLQGRQSVDPRWKAIHDDGKDFPGAEHPAMVALREGRPVRDVVMGVVTGAAQETRWLLVNSVPEFLDGRSTPHQVHTTFDDITAFRQAQERRLLDERRLQQLAKLESLGVLGGGIAHDFNNILTAILGHVDLVESEVGATSPAREDLSTIRREARRASALCRQLLAYSGKGQFVVRSLALDTWLSDVMPQLHALVPPAARLIFQASPLLFPVEGDAEQLRQLLVNVLTNAVEALPEGKGTIRVTLAPRTLERADLEGAFLGEDLREGAYACLTVADSGCGMDALAVERMFDPFYSTKFTGRGLGMPAVLGIARAHHGGVMVQSALGLGTAVTVLLPLHGSQPPAVARPVAAPMVPAVGQRILVVDDEGAIRSLARRVLQKAGYEVLLAQDGREALDVYEHRAAPIDLVLLDLLMPRLDGGATLRELRRLSPDLHVLVMSGHAGDSLARQPGDPTPDGFLEKPFTNADLLNRIHAILPAAGKART